MIGSRLLFSGYGVGFRGKPLHAGFLGQDALLVHDEAHLEPAFQELLVAIEKEQQRERDHAGELSWSKLRVMELSATSRGGRERFPNEEEQKENESHREVQKRIGAKKSIRHHKNEDEKKLGEEIGELALSLHGDSGQAVLVFVRKVEDVEKVAKKLPQGSFEQLTGTLRGLERDALVKQPIFQRFLAPANRVKDVPPAEGTVYLVCTSAGEVGIDMSADHLVCDLTTFDSMAQRFGRVNRYGDCTDTRIDVVYPAKFDEKDKLAPARRATLELLGNLDGDASPKAVGVLLASLTEDQRKAAFAPEPKILPATDILFDAWAMTSIRDKMPGRPPVEPYLRGIRDYEPPETQVAWREEVGVVTGYLLNEYPPRDLLDAYPVKSHELLRDRTARVWKELVKLAERHPQRPAWIVDEQGEVEVLPQIAELTNWDNKQAESRLRSKTVLLPHDIGGLTKQGALDGVFPPPPKQGEPPAAINADVSGQWSDDKGPMRERQWKMPDDEVDPPAGMKLACPPIVLTNPDDEDDEPIKTWHWFVRVLAVDADARSRKPYYDLEPHLNDAKEAATQFVSGLSLDPELRGTVILAAQFHDLGKERQRWQRGIGNTSYPQTKAWAKSGKRRGKIERSAYRHEFGSMLDVQTLPAFKTLSDDSRELVLHLIAAHHGRARPYFTPDECLDDNHCGEAARQQSIKVLRRFARLQRKFGRWGLAYLESLVRAADWAASAKAEGGAK
jgi:CRISPR-associated endonuclease/helicase Cas3